MASSDYESAEEDEIYFDVSEWYRVYVRDQNRNYGIIIMTEERFTLKGDKAGSAAPTFHWTGGE